MVEAVAFVLSGYVQQIDHGFMLPCFRRADGGNSWYVATAALPGDKVSAISGFESFDHPQIVLLELAARRTVGIGDPWHDVFLWGSRISVGPRQDILTDVDDLMLEISKSAPLSAFDIAFDMGQDDLPLVSQAAEWLQERYDSSLVEHILVDSILTHVLKLRIRRCASSRAWLDKLNFQDVSISRIQTGRYSIDLAKHVRFLLEEIGRAHV